MLGLIKPAHIYRKHKRIARYQKLGLKPISA